jgi:hypothetical protein
MRSEPFLGTVASFRQAYPEVRTLKLEVSHRGNVAHESQRRRVYSESRLPSKIPCPNPLCREGGYDLNTFLITLTLGRATSYQDTWWCNGREGSPRTRGRRYPCMNSAEMSIEIVYQEPGDGGTK